MSGGYNMARPQPAPRGEVVAFPFTLDRDDLHEFLKQLSRGEIATRWSTKPPAEEPVRFGGDG